MNDTLTTVALGLFIALLLLEFYRIFFGSQKCHKMWNGITVCYDNETQLAGYNPGYSALVPIQDPAGSNFTYPADPALLTGEYHQNRLLL